MNSFFRLKSCVWLVLMLITLIMSCKKDEDPEPLKGPFYPNYGQLKVGNYWIYEHFYDNGNGIFNSIGFDSSYIEKDTMINGEQYFKRVGCYAGYLLQPSVEYLRQYKEYIVSSNGFAVFSSAIPYDTLIVGVVHDTSGGIESLSYTYMADHDSIVTVPAGTFKTMSQRLTGWHYPSCNCADSLTIANVKYAEKVGIVFENRINYYRFNNPYRIYEKRLIRYHLN